MSAELKNIDSIIFDFDYTLVDSSSAIIECVSYALGKMGISLPAPEHIRKTISMSPKDALKALIPIDDQNKAEEFKFLYTQREDEVILEKTILLDGVKRVLTDLDDRGLGLGIVSNKHHNRIEEFLLREKLQQLIDVIVGFEDAPKPKPDPAGLLIAIKKLGGSKRQMFYVGDSLVDAETARRAGLTFIAVLTGTNSKQDFKSYSPRYIIDNLRELLQLV